MRDTIYALSSGALPAGIAVIRISGPRAGVALERLCGNLPPARRASLATVAWGGRVIDTGLALWFPGPTSFTGEDCAELQMHGGRSVVAAIFDSLSELPGLRPATAGEFSRRSLENGRADLTEVEGVADLIAAETELQRRQAARLAGGEFRRKCEEWRGRLIRLRAEVEAELDFSDEGDVGGRALPSRDVRELAAGMAAVLSVGSGERLREGYRVVLAGRPNSGKSTLLNALAGRDVAIVTAEAGTTRDVLEVPLDLGGYPVVVCDTAGIREAASIAEQEGVRRARATAAGADLVLWLAEPGVAFEPVEEPAGPVIRVRSKTDTAECQDGDLQVSAARGAGMEQLIALLQSKAAASLGSGEALVTRARHRHWLSTALRCVEEAAEADAAEICADLLRGATDAIGRITGQVGVEDVLDSLFGEFCIGK